MQKGDPCFIMGRPFFRWFHNKVALYQQSSYEYIQAPKETLNSAMVYTRLKIPTKVKIFFIVFSCSKSIEFAVTTTVAPAEVNPD